MLDYLSFMNARILVALCCLYSVAISAEVYRWVDADGKVNYSDRRPESAEAQPIEGTLARTGVSETGDATESEKPNSNEGEELGPYSAFEVLAPAANETLTQKTGDLPVSLILDPPLNEEHRLEVELDGVSVSVKGAATQFRLSGVPLGSHRLRALIRNTEGLILARTALQTFHLRKPQEPGLLP